MRRRRHVAGGNELPIQAHREFLGELLQPDFQTKGVNAARLENFQTKSI
jgi:hypothetical protein